MDSPLTILSFRYFVRLWAQFYVMIHLSEQFYSFLDLLRLWLWNWRLFGLFNFVASQHAVSGTYGDNKFVMDKHSGSRRVGSLRIKVWMKNGCWGRSVADSHVTRAQQPAIIRRVAEATATIGSTGGHSFLLLICYRETLDLWDTQGHQFLLQSNYS